MIKYSTQTNPPKIISSSSEEKEELLLLILVLLYLAFGARGGWRFGVGVLAFGARGVIVLFSTLPFCNSYVHSTISCSE